MPRRCAFSSSSRSPRFWCAAPTPDAPLSGFTITPLIDVLLVLLVMMILTLPTVLHTVPVDLPQGYAPPPETVTHPLVLGRDGDVMQDGVGVSGAAMPARFRVLNADRTALLVMKTDPETRYERCDQVLVEVKRAGMTWLGFAGNAAMVE